MNQKTTSSTPSSTVAYRFVGSSYDGRMTHIVIVELGAIQEVFDRIDWVFLLFYK